MQHEFITAVLEGTLKVADIDPSLQWGMVGAGAGGIGAAIKSIAQGDDLRTGAQNAALMSLLGGSVGAGISGGARLLGGDPATPGEVIAKKSKNPIPSVAGSAGVGILGGAGLLGLSEADMEARRNKGVASFMYGKGPDDVFDAPATPAGKKSPATNVDRNAAANSFLADFRKKKMTPGGAQAPDTGLKGLLNGLLGKSEYSTQGLQSLRDNITGAKATGANPVHAGHLEDLLKSLLEGEKVTKLGPSQGRYIPKLLEGVRSPKGLLAAGAGVGLAHLGIANLIHNYKKK